MQYYIDDDEFGRVIVTLRRGMRNCTARWKGEHLIMNAPAGVGEQDLRAALDRMRPGVRQHLQRRPDVTFAIGQVIDCFRCCVRLDRQSRFAGKMTFGRDGQLLTLGLPKDMDLSTEWAKRNVTRGLQALLEQQAQRLLLPYADEVAVSIGVKPDRWEVGRGMTKLGHCTRSGVIQLSRNLMFLSERLVCYIICHELAHLTHMNHSPEFHALVNAYTGGKERLLEQELKQFVWPILK